MVNTMFQLPKDPNFCVNPQDWRRRIPASRPGAFFHRGITMFRKDQDHHL